MRFFTIFSVITFYLLLTTGMYACIVHCTIDYLTEDVVSNDNSKPHKDDDCKDDGLE